MKRWVKRLIIGALVAALALVGIRFGPLLFGAGHINWISERFSETLREKNELIVYEVEITGQETVTQDAWLIGTVQKVVLPYTFSVDFTVDLSKAVVTVQDGAVEVRIPSPVCAHPKLIIDEDGIRKVDWLYPLTPERYAEITSELETRFFTEASKNTPYLDAAWNTAVHQLEQLFQSVTGQYNPQIRILMLEP